MTWRMEEDCGRQGWVWKWTNKREDNYSNIQSTLMCLYVCIHLYSVPVVKSVSLCVCCFISQGHRKALKHSHNGARMCKPAVTRGYSRSNGLEWIALTMAINFPLQSARCWSTDRDIINTKRVVIHTHAHILYTKRKEGATRALQGGEGWCGEVRCD